ncbi:MAG: non-ribosomal peptide synthetase, partial [Acidobacteriaceae bacterium]
VPKDYRAEGTLPIGRAIAHTTVHVLDADRNELPAGMPGELATGGAGVALGYLGRPEATAEKFLADPFSDRPGALLYLTGDRAVARPDGTIEFLGRIDRQVKIAGHRVELAAVENALSGSPLVADAAVVVLAVPSGEKQLVACVALASPAQNAEATLRALLQARLSRTSTPQHWLFLERLPINANGKLDRSALQTLCETRLIAGNPDQAKPAAKAQPEATAQRDRGVDETKTMAYLQELWATLLGRAAVAADENFFDLGGTSLLLIEMHARLHGEFTSTPSLVDMFAYPTSRSLAARLCAGQAAKVEAGAGELRGQRQRAAMLARRPGMHPSKVSLSAPREDGTR